MILKFNQLNENKMWYKTITEMLEWIELKSKIPNIYVDVETTGLAGPKQEQLTQVSAIASKYDLISNKFEELSQFDEKIKLTQKIKDRYAKQGDTTRRILGFNHYGSGDYKYKEERDIVDSFFNWLNSITALKRFKNSGRKNGAIRSITSTLFSSLLS